MSSITVTSVQSPTLRYVAGAGKFRVVEAVRLEATIDGLAVVVTVPAGETTNGPSYYPWLDDSMIAATYHDWLASQPKGHDILSRWDAGNLALAIKLRPGSDVPRWRAYLAWAANAALGWIWWGK